MRSIPFLPILPMRCHPLHANSKIDLPSRVRCEIQMTNNDGAIRRLLEFLYPRALP